MLMQDVTFDLVLKTYETMCMTLYYLGKNVYILAISLEEFCAFQGYNATMTNYLRKDPKSEFTHTAI